VRLAVTYHQDPRLLESRKVAALDSICAGPSQTAPNPLWIRTLSNRTNPESTPKRPIYSLTGQWSMSYRQASSVERDISLLDHTEHTEDLTEAGNMPRMVRMARAERGTSLERRPCSDVQNDLSLGLRATIGSELVSRPMVDLTASIGPAPHVYASLHADYSETIIQPMAVSMAVSSCSSFPWQPSSCIPKFSQARVLYVPRRN
jgi:hypothetical protein